MPPVLSKGRRTKRVRCGAQHDKSPHEGHERDRERDREREEKLGTGCRVVSCRSCSSSAERPRGPASGAHRLAGIELGRGPPPHPSSHYEAES